MTDLTLVAVETAHIQSYIYNTNRLRENVGASYLVAAATGDWALDSVHQVAPNQNNVEAHNNERRPIKPAQHIWEDGSSLNAEVLYAGGGKMVGLFRTPELAKDFARRLSRRVITEAPGLHITIHSARFDSDNDVLCYAVGNLLKELNAQRSQQPVSMGLVGLGVTAMCDSTSLPAVGYDPEDPDEAGPYSAETLAKRKIVKVANNYLQEQFELESYYSYPADFDHLGRSKHERSYVAVVHADGNGMGEIITGIFSKIKNNAAYVDLIQEFSERVKIIARSVQRQMIGLLQDSIERSEMNRAYLWGLNNQQPIELRPNDIYGGHYLPFRPLISGGDDITFVSDGRIGLSLSVLLLRIFERETAPLMQWLIRELATLPELADSAASLPDRLTACAGVAIVKTHYPFARAYDLSEELCSSAKALMRKSGQNCSAIDWHFTAGGLYNSLEKMREREYLTRNYRKKVQGKYTIVEQDWLTLRPIYLDRDAHDYRTWAMVERLTTEFQVLWQDHRNKAKALMDALRKGQAPTNLFALRYLQNTNLSLPDVAGFAQAYGWRDGYCGYYDALELMDLYLPLATQEAQHA